MQNYKDKLKLQLFFFKSLLKDVENNETFLKEYFKLNNLEYIDLIKKVELIILLQEKFMRVVSTRKRANGLTKDNLLHEILIIYNKVLELYTFYEPYHNPENLFLCGIRICFTNPIYWYDKMITSLQ